MIRINKILILLSILVLFVSCKKKKAKKTVTKAYYVMKSTSWGKVDFYTQSKRVTAIQVTSDTVWVGTDKGLQKFNLFGKHYQLFTTEQGLPSDYIISLAWKDKILWVGTKKGLVQYDGKSWKKLKLSIKGEITTISATKNKIWVGTTKALAVYGFGRWSVYKKNVEVTAIRPARKGGGVWAGTKKSGLFKCREGDCTKIPANVESISSIEQFGDELWISGNNAEQKARLLLVKGKNLYTYSTPKKVIWLQRFKKNVWFASGSGVYKLTDCSDSKGEKLKSISDGSPCYRYRDSKTKFPPKMTVVAEGEGNLWIGTGSLGLGRYDGDDVFYFSAKDIVSLSSTNLTVGCDKTGKCNVTAGKKPFVFEEKIGFYENKSLNIPGWTVLYFLTDKEKNSVAVAKNEDGGIGFFTHQKDGSWESNGIDLVLKTGKPKTQVSFAYYTKSYICWVGLLDGTEPSGLYVFNFNKNKAYSPRNYKTRTGANKFIPVSTKNMSVRFGHRYLATSEGVAHLWKKDKKKFISMYSESDGMISDEVADIILDNKGTLWVATDMGLCFKKSGGEMMCGEASPIPESGGILAIEHNSDHTMLYAASKTTLYRIDLNGKAQQLETHGNLLENTIKDIKIDHKDRLWVLHKRGVSILHLK
jgi:ligand-binding sensor domain-containing protein